MGTRFLATPESGAPPTHKRMILEAGAGDTVASGMWDIIWGREWAGTEVRAIRNELTARWVGREDELRTVVDTVRAEWEQASAADDTTRMCFPVGAGVGQIREVKAAGEIVGEVVADAEAILRGISAVLR
jgi:nitronate monooxygenase